MASVIACTITQARLAGKTLGADALAAMDEDIFYGNEKPNPGAVTAALEPDAASARAYLVVTNGEVGFTLLCITCSEWTKRFGPGTQSPTRL